MKMIVIIRAMIKTMIANPEIETVKIYNLSVKFHVYSESVISYI